MMKFFYTELMYLLYFLSVSSLTLHRAVSVSLQSSLESTPSLEIKDPLASIFSFLYQSFEFGSVL